MNYGFPIVPSSPSLEAIFLSMYERRLNFFPTVYNMVQMYAQWVKKIFLLLDGAIGNGVTLKKKRLFFDLTKFDEPN